MMPGLLTLALTVVAQTAAVLPALPAQDSSRRVPAAVRTGTTIGAVTGLAVGIVAWTRKDCEALQCSAKALALPLFIFSYTAAGGLIGAGIGLVVHYLGPADQAEARPPYPTQLGIGVSLSF